MKTIEQVEQQVAALRADLEEHAAETRTLADELAAHDTAMRDILAAHEAARHEIEGRYREAARAQQDVQRAVNAQIRRLTNLQQRQAVKR